MTVQRCTCGGNWVLLDTPEGVLYHHEGPEGERSWPRADCQPLTLNEAKDKLIAA